MDKHTLKLFDSIKKDIKGVFDEKKQILSFHDFVEKVWDNPERYVRSAPKYLKDCFDYFGYEEVQGLTGKIKRWKIFNKESNGVDTVHGQEEVQNKIYSYLSAFAKKGRSDKLIVLHGPNGSAKSSIIRCIMSGLEKYSHLEEGALYSFSWVFTENWDKEDDTIGFRTGKKRGKGDSYESLAYSDPDEIHFKIRSGLKDNPLSLIPIKQRKEFLNAAFARKGLSISDNHPIFQSDLSHKFKEIYNELHESHHGDWEGVLKHVQVSRFFISKRYRVGAVTIEPQRNIDAQSKALTLERDFDVPTQLKSANLHECYGDLIDASRGVVEYSDFFKRPIEVNKYLLTTSETGTVSLGSTFAYLDVLLFATSNEKHLSSFKLDPDFPSFKGRFELIKVPYLKQWTEETKVYKEKIGHLARGKHVAPHTAEFISLWATLTRLLKVIPKNYSDKQSKLASIAENLTAIEKANLYAMGEAPKHLSDSDRKTLIAGLQEIAREHDNDFAKFEGTFGNEYEGRRGASPREIQSMINEASLNPDYKCVSALSLMKEIEKISSDRSTYDFLRLDEKKVYGKISDITDQAIKEFQKWVMDEVKDSMNLVSEDEYQRVFNRYIHSVLAFIQGEKIEHPQTGRMEVPDVRFINSVEDDLNIMKNETTRKEFRESLLQRVAQWTLKNKKEQRSEEINFSKIFPDHIGSLKESFHKKYKDTVESICENLKKYEHEDFNDLSTKEKEEVETTLKNMKEKYGYCNSCAKELIIHIIENGLWK